MPRYPGGGTPGGWAESTYARSESEMRTAVARYKDKGYKVLVQKHSNEYYKYTITGYQPNDYPGKR
jgi:hypothetical protein